MNGSVLGNPQLRFDLTRAVSRRIDASDIEDVVQSTLAEAIAADQRLPEEPDQIRKFVFAIARQKVVDWYRRRGRDGTRITLDPAAEELGEVLPLGPSSDLLRWAEHELPPYPGAEQTFDWMLREGGGESLSEIAESDRLPAPVVRQRVSRLRRYLRERWVREVGAVTMTGAVGLVLFLAWHPYSAEVRIVPPSENAHAIRSSEVPTSLPPSVLTIQKLRMDQVPTQGADAFDRAAAARALASIDVSSCSSDDDAGGHITVTFGTSGAATSSVLDSGPFLGTEAGACIAAKFMQAKVPPFSGSPVKVGKTFRIRPVPK